MKHDWRVYQNLNTMGVLLMNQEQMLSNFVGKLWVLSDIW